MELKDIIREKLLAETLAERDGTIIALLQENKQMKREYEEAQAARKDGPDEG